MTLGAPDSTSESKQSKKSFTERVQQFQRTRTATESRKNLKDEAPDYHFKYEAAETNPTNTEARSNIDFIEVLSIGTGTVADNSIGPNMITASQIEALGTPTNVSQRPVILAKHSAPIIRIMPKI